MYHGVIDDVERRPSSVAIRIESGAGLCAIQIPPCNFRFKQGDHVTIHDAERVLSWHCHKIPILADANDTAPLPASAWHGAMPWSEAAGWSFSESWLRSLTDCIKARLTPDWPGHVFHIRCPHGVTLPMVRQALQMDGWKIEVLEANVPDMNGPWGLVVKAVRA